MKKDILKDILAILIISIFCFIVYLINFAVATPDLNKMIAQGDTYIIFQEDVKNNYGTIEKGTIVIVTDDEHIKTWDNHIEIER